MRVGPLEFEVIRMCLSFMSMILESTLNFKTYDRYLGTFVCWVVNFFEFVQQNQRLLIKLISNNG